MPDYIQYFLLPMACAVAGVIAVSFLTPIVAARILKKRPVAPVVADEEGTAVLRRSPIFLAHTLALGISCLAAFGAFGLYNIFADDRLIGIVQVCGAVAVFAYAVAVFVVCKFQRLEVRAHSLVLRGAFGKREVLLDDVRYYYWGGGALRLFDEFGVPAFKVSRNWVSFHLATDALDTRRLIAVGPKGPTGECMRTPQYTAYRMRLTVRNGGNVAWALFAMAVAVLIVILVCIPSSAIVTEKITGRVAGYEDYKITLLGDEKPYVINSLARPYLDETFVHAVSEGDEVTLDFYIVLGGRRDIAEIAVDGRVYLKASDVLAAEYAERESMKLGAIITACLAIAFLTVAVVCTVASKKPRAARAKDGA